MRRVALLLGFAAAAAPAQDADPIDAAIADIAEGRNAAQATMTLAGIEDGERVVRKLVAAAEDESRDVRGKANLLAALAQLDGPDAPRRALHSGSPTTRRAACMLLWNDPERKARCGEIALDWLRDEAAPDRATAAAICGRLDLDEAQPVLLAIVAREATTGAERRLLALALSAIRDPKPRELVERLLALAADKAAHGEIRGIALETLQSMKVAPRELLGLSTAILGDPAADRILRMKAALGLREFPEDRAWQALEAVLLSEKEEDRILQRNCLYSLGQMAPPDDTLSRKYLDRLRSLLLDRRVYGNPYFAVKVDVATALSALDARDPVTLDIMGDYLVDEDPKDKEHLVRQEAWLTLWTLTGTRLPDVPEPELFATPPRPLPDPLEAREHLFRRAHYRPGITSRQTAVVAGIAADLDRMRKTRETYLGLREAILEQWRKAPPEPPGT
ncbi:MAG: hypothetical protein L6Q95_03640, partial [Planctomycetes bacterium]|nr:hypothetical protein [Planctomycetota bacterium]